MNYLTKKTESRGAKDLAETGGDFLIVPQKARIRRHKGGQNRIEYALCDKGIVKISSAVLAKSACRDQVR